MTFPGFVPDDEQPLWYSSATVFAFPSRYEGFGLPLLEAMACGAPVVSSNASSLPEVVGDAGLLVDPSDVEGLCSALRQLLEDEPRRQALSAAGRARAADVLLAPDGVGDGAGVPRGARIVTTTRRRRAEARQHPDDGRRAELAERRHRSPSSPVRRSARRLAGRPARLGADGRPAGHRHADDRPGALHELGDPLRRRDRAGDRGDQLRPVLGLRAAAARPDPGLAADVRDERPLPPAARHRVVRRHPERRPEHGAGDDVAVRRGRAAAVPGDVAPDVHPGLAAGRRVRGRRAGAGPARRDAAPPARHRRRAGAGGRRQQPRPDHHAEPGGAGPPGLPGRSGSWTTTGPATSGGSGTWAASTTSSGWPTRSGSTR